MRKVNIGDLKTRITFYEYVPKTGPEPGEDEKVISYECWAKVDNVWLKDLEIAKSNNTLFDLTITIRDPLSAFIPSNKHYLSVNAPMYENKRYNIKHVQPDFQNASFITIVAGVVE